MTRGTFDRSLTGSRIVTGLVRQCLRAGYGLAIIGLVMFPVQMRAGTDTPHPHSIFQLLLDEEDGEIDHHAGERQHAREDDHAPHQVSAAPYVPDIPSIGPSDHSAEGFALLMAAIAVLSLFFTQSSRAQFPARSWPGSVVAIEPPPPRLVSG